MPKDLENVNPEGFGSAMLDSFTIDISHQEMERIIVELELLHKTQPAKWLPIEVRPVKSSPTAAAAAPTRFTQRRSPRSPQGIRNMLAEELGYEDEDEFEDALKAPFKVFLANLPHVEVRVPADDPSPLARRPGPSRPRVSTDPIDVSLRRCSKGRNPSCSPAYSATSSASSRTLRPKSASPSASSASSPRDPTSGACSCSTLAPWRRYPSWSSRSAPTTGEGWTPSTTT